MVELYIEQSAFIIKYLSKYLLSLMRGIAVVE
jgi:hypothetical protein